MLIRIRNLDYDTYPCVLHHNGGDDLSRYGLELKRHFFDLIGEPGRRFQFSKSDRLAGVQTYRRPRPQAEIRRLPELSIVTFCSYCFPGSAELSLNHFGVGVDVVRPAGTWRNIRKLGLLQRYLDGVDSQYVLYLDSHDTFVTSDILDIVGRFEKMGCPMVFQADAHDWPESDELRPFYDSIAEKDAAFRYLCSGIFMGETAFMKRVVQRALETDPIKEHDDQLRTTQRFANRLLDGRLRIADGGNARHLGAKRRQLRRQPGRVRVGPAPVEEFIADRDDLGSHDRSPG